MAHSNGDWTDDYEPAGFIAYWLLWMVVLFGGLTGISVLHFFYVAEPPGPFWPILLFGGLTWFFLWAMKRRSNYVRAHESPQKRRDREIEKLFRR